MDLPTSLWARVCQFAPAGTVSALFEATPRLKLECEGMILTTVNCEITPENTLKFPHPGLAAIAPFAALRFLNWTNPPPPTVPWFDRVTGMFAKSMPATGEWPPNLRVLDFNWQTGRGEFWKKGAFPDSITVLQIDNCLDLLEPFAFEPGWCSPFLQKLYITGVGRHQIPSFVRCIPMFLKHLSISLRESDTNISFASLEHLEKLTVWNGTVAFGRHVFPSSLKSLKLLGSGVVGRAMDRTMFPENLRKLQISATYPYEITTETFPRSLESLTMKGLTHDLLSDAHPQLLRCVKRFSSGCFPHSLRRLTLTIAQEHAMFCVGSIPPTLKTFGLTQENEEDYQFFMFEPGAFPHWVTNLSIRGVTRICKLSEM